MKIFVLVKEVPDTYSDRRLSLETGLADRGASEAVLDEITERALELALEYADANPGTEIVALSMAPESATASLRRALAIGAGSAVHVVDDELVGADLGLTAEVLAAAIRRHQPELVIAGDVSTDGGGGVIPAMIAEHLGYTQLTALKAVEITSDSVSGTRLTDFGEQPVSASLPLVMSITEAFSEARFPNFKGIVAAKKKPIEVLSLADLGVSADPTAAPRAIMISVAQKPPRAGGIKIIDEGDAGVQLAEFLVQKQLV